MVTQISPRPRRSPSKDGGTDNVAQQPTALHVGSVGPFLFEKQKGISSSTKFFTCCSLLLFELLHQILTNGKHELFLGTLGSASSKQDSSQQCPQWHGTAQRKHQHLAKDSSLPLKSKPETSAAPQPGTAAPLPDTSREAHYTQGHPQQQFSIALGDGGCLRTASPWERPSVRPRRDPPPRDPLAERPVLPAVSTGRRHSAELQQG